MNQGYSSPKVVVKRAVESVEEFLGFLLLYQTTRYEVKVYWTPGRVVGSSVTTKMPESSDLKVSVNIQV